MKKRLRKKKHLAEFAEYGVSIVIVREHERDFDAFLDDFILQAIERNACYFGGGGGADRLNGVIELGRMSDQSEIKLQKVKAWLAARKDVVRFATGKMLDLWYGSFEDEDAELIPSNL